MTTKDSSIGELKVQADMIASMLKAAERGSKFNGPFGEKVEEARRDKDSLQIGIVMDDKLITVDIPWATIRDTGEAGLSEYILKQMREEANNA